MQIVEQPRLDERGGMIDKLISKLGVIPGQTSKDLASAAKGRVKGKEIYDVVRDAWIQYAGHDNVNKNDSEALKSYLLDYLQLPADFVASVPGLDKPKANLSVALRAVGEEIAKHVEDKSSKGKLGSSRQVSQSTLDPAVISVMKNELNGNTKNVIGLAKQAVRNESELKKRPLALLGYILLQKGGQLG